MGTRKTKLEKLLEKGSEVAHTVMLNRGVIIEHASDIENELSNIITWCFYPAKYTAKKVSNELLDENGIIFKSIILNKLDFVDKIRILKEVILAKKPDIWKHHSNLLKDIISNIDKVRIFRNIIAHSSSDLSVNYLESIDMGTYEKNKEFQVIEFKNGRLIKHKINEIKFESEKWNSVRTGLKLSQLFALINNDLETYKDLEKLVTPISDLLRDLRNFSAA